MLRKTGFYLADTHSRRGLHHHSQILTRLILFSRLFRTLARECRSVRFRVWFCECVVEKLDYSINEKSLIGVERILLLRKWLFTLQWNLFSATTMFSYRQLYLCWQHPCVRAISGRSTNVNFTCRHHQFHHLTMIWIKSLKLNHCHHHHRLHHIHPLRVRHRQFPLILTWVWVNTLATSCPMSS